MNSKKLFIVETAISWIPPKNAQSGKIEYECDLDKIGLTYAGLFTHVDIQVNCVSVILHVKMLSDFLFYLCLFEQQTK